MATQTQVFDLYYVLVEVIFGNILSSWFGLIIIFSIFGFMMRMSPYSIFFLVMIFSLVFGIGYAGAIVAIPIFIGAFLYFTYNLIQFTRRFV